MSKRNELEIALKKIGWSLRTRSSDGSFMGLFNHLDEPTAFTVSSGGLSCGVLPRVATEVMFGKEASKYGASGSLHFDLDQCEIQCDDNECVSVSAQGVFVSFYNFSRATRNDKQDTQKGAKA